MSGRERHRRPSRKRRVRLFTRKLRGFEGFNDGVPLGLYRGPVPEGYVMVVCYLCGRIGFTPPDSAPPDGVVTACPRCIGLS